MVLTSYNQAEILHQMKIERLRAVREQSKNHSLSRTSNYCSNKSQLKQHIHEQKRKENIQNQQKDRQKLEQKLHRVLVDTGTGHDAAHHFTNHELARQQRSANRTDRLQKRQVKHSQVAAIRFQKEQKVTQEAADHPRRLARQRDEQSLLDREAAHLQAESLAASRALLARSQQREETLHAHAAQNHLQQYSQQGAISVLQRGRVVVQARVTRHGATADHDPAIVINQSEIYKDNLTKSRKDTLLKQLISRHVVQARNQKAKKASVDNNAFSHIEDSFTILSSLDRSNDRRNRVKSMEDVRRRNTQQKDTRLTGGTGRNPAAYDALLRQQFEKDFLDGEVTTGEKTASSGGGRGGQREIVSEHSQYAWQKASETISTTNIETRTDSSVSGVDRRKAKTDTGQKVHRHQKKTLPVSPVKKLPGVHTATAPPPAESAVPQWRPVQPEGQSLSSGLLGQPTLIPTQMAAFLTQEDPYMGVGRGGGKDTGSTSSSSLSGEGDMLGLGEQNVYELLAGMAQAQGAAATVLHQTEQALQQLDTSEGSALDFVQSSVHQHQYQHHTLKVENGYDDHGTGEGHEARAGAGAGAGVAYSPSVTSSSSNSSSGGDDDSKKFQYIFEYDAVNSQTQGQSLSAPTFSPAMEYVPAQLLHEPVGDVRVERVRGQQGKRIDAFPLGNATARMNTDVNIFSSEDAVVLDSPSLSASASVEREERQGQHAAPVRVQEEEVKGEMSVVVEVLDLSDDSLRVDPTRYEKYLQEISAETAQSEQAFLLDPFSEEEENPHHTGPFTPPFAPVVGLTGGASTPQRVPSLTIATTPGSIDSEDMILNALAKKSSGSNRNRADFSIDSNDVVFKDGVMRSQKKEKRKHSISSEVTTEAYHDIRQGVLMNMSALSDDSEREGERGRVRDMRGKHIPAFEEMSLSSVSADGGLEEDSLSVEEEKEVKEEKRGEYREYKLYKERRLHRVLSDINDDESDNMSCDSILEAGVSARESEAQLSAKSSGDGKRSLPFSYSFSSDEEHTSQQDEWLQSQPTQQSMAGAENEDEGELTSTTEASALRWQIPPYSSGSGSGSGSGGSRDGGSVESDRRMLFNDFSKTQQHSEHVIRGLDTLSTATTTLLLTSDGDNVLDSSGNFDTSVSNSAELDRGSGVKSLNDYDIFSDANEDNAGGDTAEEKGGARKGRDDGVGGGDQGQFYEDDDASEVTMDWENLVHTLDVYSSSAALGGDGGSSASDSPSPFSSVGSSSLFVSDTEMRQAPEGFGENYIDHASDDSDEEGGQGSDDEDDDEEDFLMTIQSSASTGSETIPLLPVATSTMPASARGSSSSSSSDVHVTSYRSIVSGTPRQATSTVSSSSASSNQVALDFISKYQLEGILSDDFSSSGSSSAAPSLLPPPSVPSSLQSGDAATSVIARRGTSTRSTHSHSHTHTSITSTSRSAASSRIAVSDDAASRISGAFSTGSDAFDLRLSLLSSSTGSDSDSDDDDNDTADELNVGKSLPHSVPPPVMDVATGSPASGANSTSTAEVLATVRTSRAAVRARSQASSWLQEPSFSVASSTSSSTSTSSDGDWKEALTQSYLSASTTARQVRQSQEGSSSPSSTSRRAVELSSVGSDMEIEVDTDTAADTAAHTATATASATQQRSILADMDIFFSDSEDSASVAGLRERHLADVISDSDDFLGDLSMSEDSVGGSGIGGGGGGGGGVLRHARLSSTGVRHAQGHTLSGEEEEEEEDSTDRILSNWRNSQSSRSSPGMGPISSAGGRSGFLGSGSGSTSEVDPIHTLQQLIAANEVDMNRDMDYSGSSGDGGDTRGSHSDSSIVLAEEEEGEVSLGDLLGFNEDSAFSLSDDTTS